MLKLRQRSHTALCAICLSVTVLFAFPAGAEGWLDSPVSGGSKLHRGLDKNGLEALVTTLKESGRIAIDIEAGKKSGCLEVQRQCLRYDVVSTNNADNRRWRLKVALSQDGYSAFWTSSKNQGLRPADIEVDVINHYYKGFDEGRYNQETKFAALFVENKEGLAWASHSRRTDLQYQDAYQKRVHEQGMTVIDYEEYDTQYADSGPFYAVIFVKDKAGRASISQRRILKDTFAQRRENLMAKGFRPLFVNDVGGGRYAVTWLKDPAFSAKVFTRLTLNQLRNKNNALKKDGYARIDIENRSKVGGYRSKYWGSIWLRRSPTLAKPVLTLDQPSPPRPAVRMKTKERD